LCSLIISDSVAVEIFAIGQPCAKIFRKVWCATFFETRCRFDSFCKNHICNSLFVLQFFSSDSNCKLFSFVLVNQSAVHQLNVIASRPSSS